MFVPLDCAFVTNALLLLDYCICTHLLQIQIGTHGSMVEALCYKQEDRGFATDKVD
jgi:hypothetical protein